MLTQYRCTRWTAQLSLGLIALLMGAAAAASEQAAPDHAEARVTQPINRGWAYHAGDRDDRPQEAGYDDSSWETVHVPHSFVQPYWMDRVHFGGVGWYRKVLPIDAAHAGRRVHLEFEGAFQHTRVYVNGREVGEHRGGFTGFTFDITDHLLFGQDNTLALRVCAEWDPQIAPRTGDFSFIGGLYRDVTLVVTDPVHVPWYGTFVSTPFGGELTDTDYSLPRHHDRAPVRAQTEVRNTTDRAQPVRVVTRVFDADGVEVAADQTTRDVPADGLVEFVQDMTVDQPRFWSPRDPYLYRVSTEVYRGDTLADTYLTPLGIRWFQATANEGLWLNGKRLRLRGFNVHQDHAGWGWAVTDAGFYRDIRLMRNAGANFIRGSHYPKDPALLAACDRFGLVMMQELAYWGRGGGGGPTASPARGSSDFAPFRENVEQQLAAMIRVSRNNPSVLIWSLTNEPTGGELSTTPLHELARRLDPTRPTCRVTNFSHGEADIYGRNGGTPGRGEAPVMFSELWEREELRPGRFPSRPDPEAYYSMGTARWAGFDYGTHHDWNLNLVGVFDNARLPKRRYHWHRAAWLGIDPPVWPSEGTPAKLSLSTEKTVVGTNGQDGTQLVVRVLDEAGRQLNASLPITLSVAAGPGRFPTGRSLQLEAVDGTAGIALRADTPGATVIKAHAEGIPQARLELAFVEGGIQQHPSPEPWPTDAELPDLPDLAEGRPAAARTSEPRNPAGHGTDGSLASRWCAADGDADQWWQVDLGRPQDLGGVGITFEQYAAYAFLIQTSNNGQDWTTVSDQSQSSRITRDRHLPFRARGRYVRIWFLDLPEGVWASHHAVRVYPGESG